MTNKRRRASASSGPTTFEAVVYAESEEDVAELREMAAAESITIEESTVDTFESEWQPKLRLRISAPSQKDAAAVVLRWASAEPDRRMISLSAAQ
jgi:hypothetical protein